MQLMHELLLEIQAGTMHFRPQGDSSDELREFQAVAKRIESAVNLGYISDAKIERSRARETYNLAKQVIAIGPLTLEGERFLATDERSSAHSVLANNQIFQLKPSFYGITIDMRAAYQWLTGKMRQWIGK